MKKKLLFLLTLIALLCALCFCASAAVHSGGTHYDERPLYPDDPLVKIVDGVAYEPRGYSYNYKTNEVTDVREYWVIDYFATNKLAKTATEINIVPEIDGVPVTQIVARYNPNTRNETVTKLTIPDSVTHIEHLFLFSSLETVKLPESLVLLGDRCFARMENLKEIALPKGLTSIPRNCFRACNNLETVTFLGDAVKTIGANAFYGCKQLTNIDLPFTVGSIGNGAFAKSGITHLGLSGNCKLPTESSSYGDTVPAFYACKNLKEVYFEGDSIFNIHSSAYIPHDTFKNCTALQKVTLPIARHLTVGEHAFLNCKALETVVNSEFIEFAPAGAFQNCVSLKKITIGNWADRIGKDTFKGCTGLKKLILKADNVLLFDARYPRYDRNWTGNFLRHVPKSCRVYVPNDTMQQAVVSHGFTGKVIVREMRDLAMTDNDRV